jgi:RNA polymerase sigma-70 factor (ECF subfamily)
MRRSTDAELIAKSRERGEEFQPIFDRHAGRIMRYLRLRVGDHLAEELTAETFTQAFRSRDRFSTAQSSALPWLYGIAGNLVRMHWRSEQRRLDAYARSAALGELAAPSSDAGLDLTQLTPALTRGLSVLPPGEREVLLLHAWAELSHKEIADVLGISGGLVRKRLQRARRYLSSQLERSDRSVTPSGAREERSA